MAGRKLWGFPSIRGGLGPNVTVTVPLSLQTCRPILLPTRLLPTATMPTPPGVNARAHCHGNLGLMTVGLTIFVLGLMAGTVLDLSALPPGDPKSAIQSLLGHLERPASSNSAAVVSESMQPSTASVFPFPGPPTRRRALGTFLPAARSVNHPCKRLISGVSICTPVGRPRL